jgi:predicted AAA+ superfamily ATPase
MTILQRDVRDIANIADLTAILRLLQLAASRVGGLLNFADLSRSLALPQTTLKRYSLRWWKPPSWSCSCQPGQAIWASA